MAFSYQSSRKNSTNVSANELYYITRNVFKRNKAFQQKGYTFNIRKGNYISNPTSSRYMQYEDDKSYTANQSFEKFFSTSAKNTEIKQIQDFNKSKQRFFYTRERTLSLANIDPEQYPYRQVFPRSPEYNFGKTQERINMFSQNKLDDERRYNNFFMCKTNFSKTLGMQKMTPRPNFAFQVNMQDKIYDNSYNAYQKIVFNTTDEKCLFDHNKQLQNKAGRNCDLNDQKYPLRVQIDRDSIERAERQISPYKKMNIPSFNKQIGRDRPGSSPYNICLLYTSPSPRDQA
eukprot:TRINITY_DN5406_c0_g1_i3.p1 TRINITY_DN5406_c0_g1~~TRINITY_DN5406_c0_g1_i3.p1  ORF type:complete len:288 (+),score=36.46 TRINITY_DN5406_c0_g1_i3:126-989(+)